MVPPIRRQSLRPLLLNLLLLRLPLSLSPLKSLLKLPRLKLLLRLNQTLPLPNQLRVRNPKSPTVMWSLMHTFATFTKQKKCWISSEVKEETAAPGKPEKRKSVFNFMNKIKVKIYIHVQHTTLLWMFQRQFTDPDCQWNPFFFFLASQVSWAQVHRCSYHWRAYRRWDYRIRCTWDYWGYCSAYCWRTHCWSCCCRRHWPCRR